MRPRDTESADSEQLQQRTIESQLQPGESVPSTRQRGGRDATSLVVIQIHSGQFGSGTYDHEAGPITLLIKAIGNTEPSCLTIAGLVPERVIRSGGSVEIPLEDVSPGEYVMRLIGADQRERTAVLRVRRDAVNES